MPVLPTDARPTPVDSPVSVDAHAILQLAMRIGDVLLSSGMSANDVVLFVLRITAAYGLTGVHVDVTYTSLAASYHPGPGLAPVTAIRVVRPAEADYTRVRRLLRLATRIERGLPVAQAAEALAEIRAAPHPYPRVVSILGHAALAPAVSLLFTTDWKILLLTFLTGCVAELITTVLDRRRVPPFFRQLVAATATTMVAAGITYAGRNGIEFFVGVDPTLVVVGGIVMLLSGVMMVGAVQDAIDQFYVTASARVLEVFMRTGGIVGGIVVGLALAQYLEVPLTISSQPIEHGPVPAQYAAAGLIAVMYAIYVYADPLTIVFCAMMALIGWVGYETALRLHLAAVPANTVAALLAAVVTSLIVRRSHSLPAFGLVTAALVPLVPGLAIYRGLLQVVGPQPGTENPAEGSATLLQALGVALGIGAGATLGIYLGRPLADTVRRITFFGRRRTALPD